MNYKILILCSLYALLPMNLAIACDCVKTTNKFIDNFKYQLIIHAKVVEQIKYSYIHDDELSNFGGLTKLVILKSFKGKLFTDTILHQNFDPASCGSTLEGLKIGQELILKANVAESLEIHDFRHYDPRIRTPDKNDRFFEYLSSQNLNIRIPICDYGIIPIIDGCVEDEIRTNNTSEKLKINELSRIIEKEILLR